MENVILVIHLFLALAIIGLVLLQRSEGGGLGIGGGGGLGGLSTPKGTADVLTKATAWCAAAFFCTSLLLGILAGQNTSPRGILENLDDNQPAQEQLEEVIPNVPVEPAESVPEAPIAE